MCTGIVENRKVSGSGKGPDGWYPLDRASVSYEPLSRGVVDEGSTHQRTVADYCNVSLLCSDQGRPQTHPDNCTLYPTVGNDVVQSKGLVREEQDPCNNIR